MFEPEDRLISNSTEPSYFKVLEKDGDKGCIVWCQNGSWGATYDAEMNIIFDFFEDRGYRYYKKDIKMQSINLTLVKSGKQIKAERDNKLAEMLYNADNSCEHGIELLWSGFKCKKCDGWHCA